MKVPEKIYRHQTTGNPRFNGMYYEHKPAKIRYNDKIIEYIRKDAFIEKVVNFLEVLGYAYTITDNITKSLYDNTQLIEDFKKYMEE